MVVASKPIHKRANNNNFEARSVKLQLVLSVHTHICVPPLSLTLRFLIHSTCAMTVIMSREKRHRYYYIGTCQNVAFKAIPQFTLSTLVLRPASG